MHSILLYIYSVLIFSLFSHFFPLHVLSQQIYFLFSFYTYILSLRLFCKHLQQQYSSNLMYCFVFVFSYKFNSVVQIENYTRCLLIFNPLTMLKLKFYTYFSLAQLSTSHWKLPQCSTVNFFTVLSNLNGWGTGYPCSCIFKATVTGFQYLLKILKSLNDF